jgi:hypothetical protein
VASLSVVAATIDSRPPAPGDLTPFQSDVWGRVVASEAGSFFRTAALQALLKEFCRHVEAADILARSIDAFEPSWLATDGGLARYGTLLKLRDRESKQGNEAPAHESISVHSSSGFDGLEKFVHKTEAMGAAPMTTSTARVLEELQKVAMMLGADE